MSFIKLSKPFFALSLLVMTASAVLLVYPGPRLSIEFTGGTLMEVDLPEGKTRENLQTAVSSFQKGGKPLEGVSIATTKTDTYFVRMETLTNEEHQQLLSHLQKQLPEVKELQYTTIGPTVGATLKKRSAVAIFVASLAIIIYLAFAFRKMPKQLNPWVFGVAAILALLHDVLITLGIFTILSHTTTFQLDTLFFTALLSVMGYSVSDTIVIFDRIRDNVITDPRGDFATTANTSLVQSMSRTLNTGLGALIMLFALFFFASESIRWFVLTLIIGTLIGTYSSFFIATPSLVFWRNWSTKRR